MLVQSQARDGSHAHVFSYRVVVSDCEYYATRVVFPSLMAGSTCFSPSWRQSVTARGVREGREGDANMRCFLLQGGHKCLRGDCGTCHVLLYVAAYVFRFMESMSDCVLAGERRHSC